MKGNSDDRQVPTHSKKMWHRWMRTITLGILSLSLTAIPSIVPQTVEASNHDDGEVNTKGRNLNLTDLYV